MRFAASFVILTTVLFTFALGSSLSSLIDVEGYDGDTTGRYIVTLKSGISKPAFLQETLGPSAVVATHDWSEGYMNGFACGMHPGALHGSAKLRVLQGKTRGSLIHAFIDMMSGNADHVDHRNVNFPYTYDNSSGAGVDIYVVDTGVYTNHARFLFIRKFVYALMHTSADALGGGPLLARTALKIQMGMVHTARTSHSRLPSRPFMYPLEFGSATAAGTRFGVAKQANIIAVKVLGNDNGTGTIADIISGLEYVFNSSLASGRPSIASLSLGGSASTPLDTAVAQLTSAGIHVVVAAGNSNVSASSSSPARAPSAVTVGASSINDTRWQMSNFGSVVDIFAPGVSIPSAWIGNPNAVAITDGTSMATPHISGLIAYLITLEGSLTPAQMKSRINTLALNNVLANVRPNISQGKFDFTE
ncbi:hypothetical protein H0H92_012502 [Tricholoma furcatifolium]|nr:hypothetical protein H0H92_012502 [Tricholoma furcatifolium]